MAIPSGGLSSGCSSARRALYSAILLALGAGQAHALPQGGQVVAGDAAIATDGSHMTVQQNSDRAVLEYQSFNVDSGERVQFIQPGADSVALNRVVGNELSTIAGQIDANGQIYLINPNGVLFGQGAQVDVGALVTSTLNMSNEDFLAGRNAFAGDGGSIHNEGHLQAAGDVVLIAPQVINDGVIEAARVALAAGKQVLLNPPGSSIPILIEDAATLASIHNSGTIQAAEASLQVRNGELRNDGLVRAQAISGEGGRIELSGSDSTIINNGALDASAASGDGGEVSVDANRYGQTGSVTAAGAGNGDGGNVDIHADDTIILQNTAQIDASAGEQGTGGDVIVLAENATAFKAGAAIAARGGSVAGDGGFVEVSGRQNVQVAGTMDASATDGKAGLWYIDPANISINDNGVNESFFDTTNDPWEWELDGATDAQIDIDTLMGALLGGNNVIIDTSRGEATTGNFDINLDVDIDFDGVPDGVTLSLFADNDVRIADGVRIYDSAGGDNSLNLVLLARDFNVIFGAGSSVDAGAGTVDISAGGRIDVGSITTTSTSDDAVRLVAGIEAGSDIKSIRGNGDVTAGISAPNGGVFLSAVEAINSNNDITLDVNRLGFRAGSGTFNYSTTGDMILTGINLSGAASFNAETDGDINFWGTQGGSLDGSSGSIDITSTAGSVTFNGTLSAAPGVPSATDMTINAFDSVFMANDARVHSGDGVIRINTTTGGAALTGLSSGSNATDAIQINLGGGALSNPGDINPVDIAAPGGGLIINAPGGAYGISIDAQTLDITTTTGAVALSDANDLTVINLNLGQGAELQAGGTLTFTNASLQALTELNASAGNALVVPDAGLNLTGDMTLNAPDIRTVAGSRSFSLTAPTISITSAASAGDLNISSTTSELSINNTGAGRIAVTDTDGLTLGSLGFANGTVAIGTGSGSNLVVGNDVDLDGQNGTLELNAAGDVRVLANMADQTGAVDNSTNLIFNAVGNMFFDPNATVNAGAGSITANTGQQINMGALTAASIDLTAGTDIVDGNGAAVNLIADSVSLTSVNGIGTDSLALGLDTGSAALTATNGNIYVSNTGALTVTSLTAGDDVNISNSSGDLDWRLLTPVIGGAVTIMLGDGNWLIPEAGVAVSGNLAVTARGIRDTDSAVSLSATNASLNLSETAGDLTLNSAFSTLDLTTATSGTVQVLNSAGLSVAAANTQGALVLDTAGGDLELPAALAVAGNLSLNAGAGQVILAETGLSHSGNLQITAGGIADSDSTVILGGDQAELNLASATDLQLQTEFNTLALSQTGTGAIEVTDASDLTLSSLASAGNTALNASNGNLTLAADPVVAGNLLLNTLGSGDVVLPVTGLSHAGDLTITADNLTDGDNTVTLAAGNAQVSLRDGNTDALWNTTVDVLAVNVAGTGTVTINNSGALQLNALSTRADTRVTASDGNLTLTASPTVVGGNLVLATAGSGDVVLPAGGLSHSGDLFITADNLTDGDNEVSFAAANASVTLRDGSADALWQTTVATLAASSAGSGALTINNSGSLSVTALANGGDTSLTSAGDLILLASNPNVGGTLTLNSGANRLQLADAGLHVANGLDITAADMSDSDRNIALSATDARINLTAPAQPLVISSQFSTLDLTSSGAEITLNQNGALSLNGLATDQAVTLNNNGALTLGIDTLNTNGPVVLDSGTAAIILAGTGLSTGGSLQITSGNLSDSDGGAITLAATDLTLALGNSGALDLVTGTDTLGLSAPALNSLAINNDRDLSLNQWAAPLLNTVSFTVNGLLTILDSGLEAASRLDIVANDLADADRSLRLAAPSLNLQLAQPAADLVIEGTAQLLDLWLGARNVQYRQEGSLTLTDLNGDNRAAAADNGNLNVAVSNGDLAVAGDVSASDGVADGIRQGQVDLTVSNGNLTVGANGDVTVTSSSGADATDGSGLAPGISLQLLGTEADDRAITLGNGLNTVTLTADGADIFINAKAPGTPDDAGRAFVQRGGVMIRAYDQPSDPNTGEVTINGTVVAAATGQQIGSGRRLAITSDFVPDVAGDDYLEGKDPVDNIETPAEPGTQPGDQVDAQFARVFGQCNETGEEGEKRCRIEAALKSFLSHWLVGGELPPRTEI